jgi:RNA polymerase sigma factor (sigma-70 family)
MPDNAIPALRDFLVQRYADLKQRLTRQLGSAEMASDALQDAWLRLESREDIDTVQNMGAYLIRMAVNIAIDYQRSNSRLLTAEEVDTLVDLPDPMPGPAETAEARSELNALIEVMQSMPQRRQQILLMVRWEGLPQQEVADRLGVSLRTIEKELKLAHDYCAARTRVAALGRVLKK